MGISNKLTYERLTELLLYDQETGIFTWRKSRKGVTKGNIAGCIDKGKNSGYIRIKIDRILQLGHRLAFLYMEGYFPEHDVDHINRIRHDNRWCNLRHVSRSCNIRNTDVMYRSTSGVTGVNWNKVAKRWTPTAYNKLKLVYMGRYINFSDAVMVRWLAEVKYGYNNCNSTSPAYNYLKEHNLLP